MKFSNLLALVSISIFITQSSCNLFDTNDCNATYAINDGAEDQECVFLTDELAGLWHQTGAWTSDSCGTGVINRDVILTPYNYDTYYLYYYSYTGSYVKGKAFLIPCLPTGSPTDDCIAFLNSNLYTFSINSAVHNTPLNQNWIITGDGEISPGLDTINIVYSGYAYYPTDTCYTSGQYLMYR
jgi:hypothetical protein